MRLQNTSNFLLSAVLAVIVGCAPSGGDLAHQDIRNGHLMLRSAGMPAPWVPDYAALLRSQLNVGYRLEGCVVTDSSVHEMGEYDAVMEAEIERRFGTGILTRLRDDAIAKYHARNGAASRPAA